MKAINHSRKVWDLWETLSTNKCFSWPCGVLNMCVDMRVCMCVGGAMLRCKVVGVRVCVETGGVKRNKTPIVQDQLCFERTDFKSACGGYWSQTGWVCGCGGEIRGGDWRMGGWIVGKQAFSRGRRDGVMIRDFYSGYLNCLVPITQNGLLYFLCSSTLRLWHY